MTQIIENRTRQIAALLILLLAFTGSVIFIWTSYRTQSELGFLEAKYLVAEESGSAIYAIKEIKQGDFIAATSLETRVIPVNKMPDHIVTRMEEAVGRKARFAISSNDILSLYDLDPYPPYLPVYVVEAARDIPKGMVISKDAVVINQHFAKDLPKLWYEKPDKIVGQSAAQDISKDQILSKEDIFP